VAGISYGLLAGSLRKPWVAYGPFSGAGVMAISDVVLPPTGFYTVLGLRPGPLAKDLSANLLCGTTTAATYTGLAKH
jgi:hypothetical protein